MSNPLYDVAVLGGGPAGSACAISLRRNFPGLQVILLERSRYTEARIGEALPAAALPLLRQLGIAADSLAELGVRSHSVASAWGEPTLIEQHSLLSTAGNGLHLDRNRFDRMLCERASTNGVCVRLGTRFHNAQRERDLWRLQLNHAKELHARFIVDATGQSAVFARSQGIIRYTLDHLTSYSCFFSGQGDDESRILIEACELGWWYTAPLPRGRRIVSFLSDVDLAREAGLPGLDTWLHQLAGTEHIAPLVASLMRETNCIVKPASTAFLSAPGGEGWLATGDALASCNPLAAQGITKALHSGILASFAAADALAGNAQTSFSRYGALLARNFESYLHQHAMHHAQERRWPDQPFWIRRSRNAAQEPEPQPYAMATL